MAKNKAKQRAEYEFLDDSVNYLIKLGYIPISDAMVIDRGGGMLRKGMMCYAYPISMEYWELPGYTRAGKPIRVRTEWIDSYEKTTFPSPAAKERGDYGKSKRIRSTTTARVGPSPAEIVVVDEL